MRFYSAQYPNITLRFEGTKVSFKDGYYDTTDAKEIAFLRKNGYPETESFIEQIQPEQKESEKGAKHIIPVRWTKAEIVEYAKRAGIELPGNLVTKQDMIDYIEGL